MAGLDVEGLKAQVNAAWEARGGDDENIAAFGQHLSHLDPVIHNAEVRAAVINYFGGEEAIITGYTILHLGARVDYDHYPSGQWHHDRNGRKLKLFVYLDVRRMSLNFAFGSSFKPFPFSGVHYLRDRSV